MAKDQILLQRKNKFLSIGRNKGFENSSEAEESLTLKRSLFEKIKNQIIQNKKNYFISVITLIVLLMFILLL